MTVITEKKKKEKKEKGKEVCNLSQKIQIYGHTKYQSYELHYEQIKEAHCG
jgi:hypothetical protein